MGLEIRQEQSAAEEQFPLTAGAPVERITVDKHWYLTEDKDRVVREGDPAGRTLWATPGMDVPKADAVRLGAYTEEPEVKERVPAENKQRRGAATKAPK